MPEKVTLVQWEEGDWVALFVGDELRAEGHSLDDEQVLEALGVEYEVVYTPGTEDDFTLCRSTDSLREMRRKIAELETEEAEAAKEKLEEQIAGLKRQIDELGREADGA